MKKTSRTYFILTQSSISESHCLTHLLFYSGDFQLLDSGRGAEALPSIQELCYATQGVGLHSL